MSLLRPFAKRNYDYVVSKLVEFAKCKGLLALDTSNPSTLAVSNDRVAACDIGEYTFPVPQTTAMHLERAILDDGFYDSTPGYFSIMTSVRNEQDPVFGRDDRSFQLFEFVARGEEQDWKQWNLDLLLHLGFHDPFTLTYEQARKRFDSSDIGAAEEWDLGRDEPLIFLDYSPLSVEPHWFTRRMPNSDVVYDEAVLAEGLRAMSTSLRSCDPDDMRERFHTTQNGKLAKSLFCHFGKERVIQELNEYLCKDLFSRFGGGISIWRLMYGMALNDLLPEPEMDLLHNPATPEYYAEKGREEIDLYLPAL